MTPFFVCRHPFQGSENIQEGFIISSTASPRIYGQEDHQISPRSISPSALTVLRRLHENGKRACLVGGAVRDLLLGRAPKDFDIATDALPEEVNDLFRGCRLIGRRFRLAHVRVGREILEVATFRAPHDEAESGHEAATEETGRILRDNVFGSIEQDVWRRDFTVNSLYYDFADASVIDYTGGVEDVRKGVLTMIGDAETRYREDPVRMLRAVRFAAKLGFSIDAASEAAIHKLHPMLEDASPARLFEEFLKLMHSGHSVACFELLRKFDLFGHLFPASDHFLDGGEGEVLERFMLTALENTDRRVKEGLPVTPAFLISVFLWGPVQHKKQQLIDTGVAPAIAMQRAAQQVFAQQIRHVAVPRRFSTMVKEIWDLQARFGRTRGKRVQRLAQHKRFRAAYDFLCLRAKTWSDQTLVDQCRWWTDYQETDAYKAIRERSAPKKRSRRPPRKRRSRQHA